MNTFKIAILGAGLAGVELGRLLKKNSTENFIIIEKESKPGGLCRTNITGNIIWDYGVHAMYSKNDEIKNYYKSLPLHYNKIIRDVKIFHTGYNKKKYYLNYPFEYGIRNLPPKELIECLFYLSRARLTNNNNYKTLNCWIKNFYGKGIQNYFMYPYNKKIWNCPLSEISTALISKKIEPDSFHKILCSVLFNKGIGRAYQNEFLYPKNGIYELINNISSSINEKIILNSNITALNKTNENWEIILPDKRIVRAHTIISTIPLVSLLKMINIRELKKEYNELKYNGTFFFMIALKNKIKNSNYRNSHWLFFKEDEIFYRITFMHNLTNQSFPILIVEVTKKNVSTSFNKLEELIINDLVKKNIIYSINEIRTIDAKFIKFTYPIPTINLNKVKIHIKNILSKNSIHLLGRNGNWDYINMDETILKSKFMFENIKKLIL